jgi:uncharacterized glyoxalase superfamily protein PhnB
MISSANPVLAVHDLERFSAWYRDVLGCEVDEVESGDWTFCRAGGVTFMLGRCPDDPPANDIGVHAYVAYLHVDDVDAFYARALDAGAEVHGPPAYKPWRRREIALRTPDGRSFMLGQRL